MSVDHSFRQTKLSPYRAHFVFKQFTKWLDQAELHIGRQPTDIVMRLNHVRFTSSTPCRFDDIGIDRSLRKPFNISKLARLAFKYLYE